MTRPAGSRGPAASHPPSRMPAALVARRALSRRCAMGLRPTLPPTCASRREAGCEMRPGVRDAIRSPGGRSAAGSTHAVAPRWDGMPAAPSKKAVDDERAVHNYRDEARGRHRGRPQHDAGPFDGFGTRHIEDGGHVPPGGWDELVSMIERVLTTWTSRTVKRVVRRSPATMASPMSLG